MRLAICFNISKVADTPGFLLKKKTAVSMLLVRKGGGSSVYRVLYSWTRVFGVMLPLGARTERRWKGRKGVKLTFS